MTTTTTTRAELRAAIDPILDAAAARAEAAPRPTREALDAILEECGIADDPVLANAIRVDFAVAHGVPRAALVARHPEALKAAHDLIKGS